MLATNLSKQEAFRIRVYKFFEDNKKFGKMYTVNHFLAEKVPRRTIYSILSRFEYSPAKRKSGSGRTKQKLTQKKVNQIIKDFNHKAARSQRQSARKFNVSQQMISQVLKKKQNNRKKKGEDPESNRKAKNCSKSEVWESLSQESEHFMGFG